MKLEIKGNVLNEHDVIMFDKKLNKVFLLKRYQKLTQYTINEDLESYLIKETPDNILNFLIECYYNQIKSVLSLTYFDDFYREFIRNTGLKSLPFLIKMEDDNVKFLSSITIKSPEQLKNFLEHVKPFYDMEYLRYGTEDIKKYNVELNQENNTFTLEYPSLINGNEYHFRVHLEYFEPTREESILKYNNRYDEIFILKGFENLQYSGYADTVHYKYIMRDRKTIDSLMNRLTQD